MVSIVNPVQKSRSIIEIKWGRFAYPNPQRIVSCCYADGYAYKHHVNHQWVKCCRAEKLLPNRRYIDLCTEQQPGLMSQKKLISGSCSVIVATDKENLHPALSPCLVKEEKRMLSFIVSTFCPISFLLRTAFLLLCPLYSSGESGCVKGAFRNCFGTSDFSHALHQSLHLMLISSKDICQSGWWGTVIILSFYKQNTYLALTEILPHIGMGPCYKQIYTFLNTIFTVDMPVRNPYQPWCSPFGHWPTPL